MTRPKAISSTLAKTRRSRRKKAPSRKPKSADDVSESFYEKVLYSELKKIPGTVWCRNVENLVPGRKYRVDLIEMRLALIVECDGGIYMPMGRHSFADGWEDDRRRDCELHMLGYTIVHVSSEMTASGEACKIVKRYVEMLQSKARI